MKQFIFKLVGLNLSALIIYNIKPFLFLAFLAEDRLLLACILPGLKGVIKKNT